MNKALISVVLSVLILASLIDTSVTRLAVFTGGLATPWNTILFIVLVSIYAIGQYVILNFIKKLDISKISPLPMFHTIVSIVQSISALILGVIIVQMIWTSTFNIVLLISVLCISCILSVSLLGFLSKNFITWLRSNREPIMISYAIAFVILSANIVFMMVFVIDTLNTEAGQVRQINSPVSIANGTDTIFNTSYVATSIFSFVLLWLATVLLLRYYSKKIGSAKYWIIVSAPLFYFLSQFQALFIDQFESFRLSDPILFGIVFTLVFTMSKPIGGILFGLSFWIVSRKTGKHVIRDFLIVSAYGLILLFTTNQITNLIVVPYPPFGLVTASLLGLSSYMLLVGIYSSAMSISRDAQLRKYIHTVAAKEIKFLDAIGSAQLDQDLVRKIIPLAQHKAKSMEQETGVQTSLSDADMMEYLQDILTEVKNLKNTNNE